MSTTNEDKLSPYLWDSDKLVDMDFLSKMMGITICDMYVDPIHICVDFISNIADGEVGEFIQKYPQSENMWERLSKWDWNIVVLPGVNKINAYPSQIDDMEVSNYIYVDGVFNDGGMKEYRYQDFTRSCHASNPLGITLRDLTEIVYRMKPHKDAKNWHKEVYEGFKVIGMVNAVDKQITISVNFRNVDTLHPF